MGKLNFDPWVAVNIFIATLVTNLYAGLGPISGFRDVKALWPTIKFAKY